MNHFDVFWSFRSPYCYLALDRILRITEQFDVAANIRPVWPLAIRRPQFFACAHPAHLHYHSIDCERVAEYFGIPYRRPIPDPIVQDMNTGQIAKEQPYIFRLTRLGAAAAVEKKGLTFVNEVSRVLWDGSVNGWDRGAHLASAMARAGLDPRRLEDEVARDAGHYDTLIESNQEALEAIGHWGVPTFAFDDEPFFGQDRLDMLTWRMKQKGVQQKP